MSKMSAGRAQGGATYAGAKGPVAARDAPPRVGQRRPIVPRCRRVVAEMEPIATIRHVPSSAVGGGGEGGGGDYEGVRAAQQRLEGKIDEIYRMLRTQKTRDDA